MYVLEAGRSCRKPDRAQDVASARLFLVRSMCLTKLSLRRWALRAREHPDLPGNLLAAEVDEACCIWEASIWPALDHSRRYCLNPKEAVKSILREKTRPTVHERHRRRRFKSAAKDAAVVRRLEAIFAQSPPAGW